MAFRCIGQESRQHRPHEERQRLVPPIGTEKTLRVGPTIRVPKFLPVTPIVDGLS